MSKSAGNEQAHPGSAADVVATLGRLRLDVMSARALDRKAKELIALGVAVAAGCETSIAYHVHNAIEAGAGRDEVVEAVGVALFAAGEPATLHVVKLLAEVASERARG